MHSIKMEYFEFRMDTGILALLKLPIDVDFQPVHKWIRCVLECSRPFRREI